MSEKKIFSIDRFEGELAVCISDDDDVVVVSISSLGGLSQNDIFSAFIEGDGLSEITPMPEERDRRLREYRERLHALARRTKERRSQSKGDS